MPSLVNLVFEAALVKRVRRTGFQVLGEHEELLGEHLFMTAVIAYFLANKLRKSGITIDMEKVLLMSIFHDFHESRTGELDKIHLQYTSRDQGRANHDLFADSDSGLLSVLDEYEKKESDEARLVYEANILSLLVELKPMCERGNPHARDWFDGNRFRLKLPETQDLAAQLAATDSQDWWKGIRNQLFEEYSK